MKPLDEKRCTVCNRPFHCHPDAPAVCSPECAVLAKANVATAEMKVLDLPEPIK